MPSSLSIDLRERVVAAIAQGASCHGAAARFGASVSSASCWAGRVRQEGQVAERARGGGRRSQSIEARAALILSSSEARPEMHVFCMTALSMLNPAFLQGTHDEIEAQLQAGSRVDERCLNFGPHAVVVKYAPFLARLDQAMQRCEHWCSADTVTYYDDRTFHGTFDLHSAVSREQIVLFSISGRRPR